MKPAGEGRRRSALHWRLLAGTLATLLVLAALLVTGLRIGIAYLPRHADALRGWVEQQTRVRIEYERLDARLRWYGPELVLHGLRVLDEDGSQVMFEAREGSVGLDLWNFFRTGQLVAGRVAIDRPRVTFVRLADGRIRLLGLAERPSDRPPFDFDRLPAGRVVISDATVVYRDLRTGRPPLELRELQGVLRRDRDFQRIEGSALLPESLGSRVEFDLRLKGSLDERETLEARAEVRAAMLRLAGLAPLVPQHQARLHSGRGPVRAVVSVKRGHLQHVRLELALRNVELGVPARVVPPVAAVAVSNPRVELDAGAFLPHPAITQAMVQRPAAPLPARVRYEVLEGDLQLRREGDAWTFRCEGFRGQPAAVRAAKPMRIAGRAWGKPVTRFGLELEAEAVDLAQVWPLALALAPASFDRLAGLAPVGRVETLRAHVQRERAGLDPTFDVNANVAGLGVAAVGRLPGVQGVTATIAGSDRAGRVELRARDAAFDWPRLFTTPIRLASADAEVTWRRDGALWIVAAQEAKLVHAQARATASAELRIARGSASPELTLDGTVSEADVAAVPLFIPYGRLREPTIAWLDRAFVGGKVRDGKVSYRGPVRRFPFRAGEGEFVATAQVEGLALDYYPGFAPLVDGKGKAIFRNASIRAEMESGTVGGVRVGATTFDLDDYKTPVLRIAAQGTGDLTKALALVQASPLGERLGATFQGLRGSGPARYEMRLVLPVISPEAQLATGVVPPPRDWFVRAALDGVEVRLPALRAPLERVVGTFELHNGAVHVPGVRGTLLDGPFTAQARPGKASREGLSAVELEASGRLGGAGLPALIGLPGTIRMTGNADWQLRGRIEQRGVGDWPLQFDVASDLAGLAIDAPRPFAKAPAETRPTRVRLDLAGDGNDVAIETGSARAKLRFATQGGRWRLERGTARFDGQPAALTAESGLRVIGDWPEFDLAEWLAVGDAQEGAGSPPPRAGEGTQRLMDWLGNVNVHLERATVFGFRLTDVDAQLRGSGDTWSVDVRGPDAEGHITVPDQLARGRPIVLDMRRLHLVGDARDDGSGNADAATAAEPTDPRRIPALEVRADDFQWESRRFGRLEARVTRDARGLRFESLAATAPSFQIRGTGSWLVEPDAIRTRLNAKLTSTDFGATIDALGYRGAIEAREASIAGNLWWSGGPSGDVPARLNGTLRLALEDGRLRDVEPGAGRMLGLLSVAQLPRRLSLDFRDVTDQGLAFDRVTGDFEVREGNAHTRNLLLQGPAVDVGIVGRTGLAAQDYDQTMVVSGDTGGPLAVAGALAAGPVVGAGVLVLSQLFKEQLKGLARAYYHVGGTWSEPVVQRIAAPDGEPGPTAPGGDGPQKESGP